MAPEQQRDPQSDFAHDETEQNGQVVTQSAINTVTSAEREDITEKRVSHDVVGAYLLDALSDDERMLFETHLAVCEMCQADIRKLTPVVQLLPRLLEIDSFIDSTAIGNGGRTVPSAGLRTRILDGVRATPSADDQETSRDNATVMTVADVAVDKPVSPSAPSQPEDEMRPDTSTESFRENVSRHNRDRIASVALTIIAVFAILWGLGLKGQIRDLKTEIQAQNKEIAQLRGVSEAATIVLSPTTNGPTGATGTLYYSRLASQSSVLVFDGLTPAPAERVYQLWYIKGTLAPEPGPVFQTNQSGQALVSIDVYIPAYDSVVVTMEPDGGSENPTAPVLFTGELPDSDG